MLCTVCSVSHALRHPLTLHLPVTDICYLSFRSTSKDSSASAAYKAHQKQVRALCPVSGALRPVSCVLCRSKQHIEHGAC